MVFRRMSITKFFNDFTEEVPRRSWKRVVQESDFFYREKLSKTRRYDYGTSGKKKKGSTFGFNYHMLVKF